MEIPLRKRLSYRQARLTVLVAVSLGLAFSSVEFFLDLSKELRRLDSSVHRTLEVVAPGASAAASGSDRAAARGIVAALLKYPPFYIFRAEIVDDFGVRLAAEERRQAESTLDWLVDRTFGPSRTYTYPIFGGAAKPSAPEGRQESLPSPALPAAGQLLVSIDHHVVMNNFVSRWLVQFTSEAFRMSLLAGVLVWIFHLRITRPLGRMAWHYSSIDLDQPGDCRFPIPADHKEDELGLLADSVNHAMERLTANAESQKQSYFHLSREMEERRKAENALVRKEEELQQAQRLEAVGHLAAGVAQDFNHHLTTIQGYAQILKDQAPETSQIREDATHILRTCAKARDLTAEMLALSRRQTLKPVPIHLNDFLRELQPVLAAIAPGVEVRPDPAPTLWNLLADRSMLEKAVISLVASSAEALEGRGVIRLRTANQDFPPSPKGPPAGRWVCLSVQDDGPVIPRDSLSRVFEPFSAVRGPNKKKEGLRLATAYGIARQTGGHLSVSSHPASGTSFDLLLPMTEDEAARPLPGTRAATGAGGETVLVVEPDPSMRSLLARMLSSLGYRVLSAAKESEALDAARESTTPVALLLSGMELPSWSGPELLDKLRAGGSACQALFTSGAGGESSSREAFGVKPEHVLVKPFSQEELAGRIREVLDRVPIPSA